MERKSSRRLNHAPMDGREHGRQSSRTMRHQKSMIIPPKGRPAFERTKSESYVTSNRISIPPPANDGEANLRHYFATLGLPLGCLPGVLKVFHSMESRICVIDNSLEMLNNDSHLMGITGHLDVIFKEDGASRWQELQQCVDFHTKMAGRCWIPTKFWLINNPNKDNLPQKFGVCWGDGKDWAEERERASQIMKDVTPDRACAPLATVVRKITSRLVPVAAQLDQEEKFVSVIICTQGVPTDENGKKGPAVLKDYLKSLSSLASVPVKVVFRICTDDEDVLEFYNTVDAKIECDVLDDFWGEAMEVYLHNPWLNYGIGIHRLREAGLGTDLMDLLDEQPFTMEQIWQWCIEFFLGSKKTSLRRPTLDWDGFIQDLQNLLKKERQVWNPVKKKLGYWIDIEKLISMHRRQNERVHASSSGDRQELTYRKQNSFRSSMRRSASGHQRALEPSEGRHELMHRKQNSFRSSMQRSASVYQPASTSRRTTYNGEQSSPVASKSNDRSKSFHVHPSSSNTQGEQQSSPLNLKQMITKWSHEKPKKLRPLETLLIEVPTLFPPTNEFVEAHDYFGKWKVLSEDAFEGESGDGLKELLKRAARKAKFFLHPDKLPKDLTESQTLLLKSIWDTVQESEEATLN